MTTMKSMKKIIALFFLTLTFTAFSDENALTFGETLTLYFSEIFPSATRETDNITVKYNDI